MHKYTLSMVFDEDGDLTEELISKEEITVEIEDDEEVEWLLGKIGIEVNGPIPETVKIAAGIVPHIQDINIEEFDGKNWIGSWSDSDRYLRGDQYREDVIPFDQTRKIRGVAVVKPIPEEALWIANLLLILRNLGFNSYDRTKRAKPLHELKNLLKEEGLKFSDS